MASPKVASRSASIRSCCAWRSSSFRVATCPSRCSRSACCREMVRSAPRTREIWETSSNTPVPSAMPQTMRRPSRIQVWNTSGSLYTSNTSATLSRFRDEDGNVDGRQLAVPADLERVLRRGPDGLERDGRRPRQALPDARVGAKVGSDQAWLVGPHDGALAVEDLDANRLRQAQEHPAHRGDGAVGFLSTRLPECRLGNRARHRLPHVTDGAVALAIEQDMREIAGHEPSGQERGRPQGDEADEDEPPDEG